MSSQVINIPTEITSPAAGDWFYLQLNAGGAASDRKIKYQNLSPVGKSLTSGQIWIGNVSNVAAAFAVSGVVLLSNAGVTSFHSSAFGTSGTTACVGNDARLSDQRVPTNASVTEAKLSFSNVVTANASTSAHGLLPILDNNPAHFLNGQGGWTTPGGTGAPGGSNQQVQYNDSSVFNGTPVINVSGTQLSFFSGGLVSQQAGGSALTDSTTGSSGTTIVDCTTIGVADPSKVNDNFRRVLDQINFLTAALKAYTLVS